MAEWIVCPPCHGDGRVRCLPCDGEGLVLVFEINTQAPRKARCPDCRGRGTIQCPECLGAGETNAEPVDWT